MQHDHFMKLAIQKAFEGIQNGQSPFGACIVSSDGTIISREHNTLWASTDITAHAEVHAIRAACTSLGSIDLSGCTIYSTCEPCPMCFSACHWARIGTIVYGATIQDAVDTGFNELVIPSKTMTELGGSSIKLVPGVLQKEARDLFAAWRERQGPVY